MSPESDTRREGEADASQTAGAIPPPPSGLPGAGPTTPADADGSAGVPPLPGDAGQPALFETRKPSHYEEEVKS